MSDDHTFSFNPYAAPQTGNEKKEPPMPGPLPTRMEYLRAYTYIFEHPQWITTIGLLGLLGILNFVPLLNLVYALLVAGYAFTVLDCLLDSGGNVYPVFEMGKVQDYFNRGLWPFLVYLLGTVTVTLAFYGIMLALGALGFLLTLVVGEKNAGLLIFLLLLLATPVLIAILVAASAAIALMALRSGLARDFSAGFDYRWVLDFLRKMWRELVLAGLFLAATGFVLEVLGLLALCIGILFVVPIMVLAGTHLTYQLYGVYLSRGGMPVTVVVR